MSWTGNVKQKPTRAEDDTIRGYFGRLAWLATALLLGGTASASCYEQRICIDEARADDSLLIQARNLTPYPLTFTLRLSGDDYLATDRDPLTMTLKPRQTADAISLRLKDGHDHGDVTHGVQMTIGDKDANHDDDHLYAFPYASGRSYRILQGFGSRFSHTGLEQYAVDFDMPEGTPVHAARGGIVAEAVEQHSRGCWQNGCGEFANYIVILHNDGTTGEYYHLQRNGALVDVGDSVARGQRIGYSGNTGNTALPHLHFAVYRASSEGETQSIPIRFQGADGTVTRPRSGGHYRAAH